jgi:hypothetical protein
MVSTASDSIAEARVAEEVEMDVDMTTSSWMGKVARRVTGVMAVGLIMPT